MWVENKFLVWMGLLSKFIFWHSLSVWFGFKVVRLKALLFVVDGRELKVYTFSNIGESINLKLEGAD